MHLEIIIIIDIKLELFFCTTFSEKWKFAIYNEIINLFVNI